MMSPKARAARRGTPGARAGLADEVRAHDEPATEAAAEAPPPAGHNLPGASLMLDAEGWKLWLDHVFEGPIARRAEFEAPFQRFLEGFPLKANPVAGQPPIGIEKWDDEVAGRAADFRTKIAALVKLAENLHSIEKAPVLVAQKAVDGYLRAFLAPLEVIDRGKLLRGGSGMLNVIADRLTLYGIEKADRVRREAEKEAAEQLARAQAIAAEAIEADDPDKLQQAADAATVADAAAATASAPDRDLARTHGPMGSVTSLRSTWRLDVDASDLMKLLRAIVDGRAPLRFVQFNTVVIGSAIRSEKLRTCEGLAIVEDRSA